MPITAPIATLAPIAYANWNLIGTVESITVLPDRALMKMKLISAEWIHEGRHHVVSPTDDTITITLYSDEDHPGSLTNRDGMWRGAVLSLAQRALTHQNEVTVLGGQPTPKHFIALSITIHG